MYKYNIREESFGATILNLETGNREYISKEELNKVLTERTLPSDISTDEKICLSDVKYTKTNKDVNHFSFADICYLEVTRACNLQCIHCLNNSGKKLDNQLTDEELIKLVIDLSKCGIQEIRFTGGEPLVYDKIYDLINIATINGVYTSIGTNGTLITKEVAKRLKNAGLKKAVVSIDGTKEKHDEIRGKGNYERSIQGIKNLNEVGIETRVNSVIMKNNMDDIINFAKTMHEKKQSLMIRRFIESGRGKNLIDNTLSKEDYNYVKEQLSKELSEANYINGHYLREKTERISNRIDIPFDISNGCKAGMRAIIITPDANIHLCGFLAAQGFTPVENVRNVNDWKHFWHETSIKDCLSYLRKKLEDYNKMPNIQETNCLAYVKNYINRGKL